jgi:hypothetical protein
MSNKKVFNMTVVVKKFMILIAIKFVQNRVQMLQERPDYGRVLKQFRDSKNW